MCRVLQKSAVEQRKVKRPPLYCDVIYKTRQDVHRGQISVSSAQRMKNTDCNPRGCSAMLSYIIAPQDVKDTQGRMDGCRGRFEEVVAPCWPRSIPRSFAMYC